MIVFSAISEILKNKVVGSEHFTTENLALFTLKVEIRSNTDNHITFTDKFGDKWPKQSAFESSPAERKYQKEGKALLIAVNDDYTEKQKKSGKWVKDNIAGDKGHTIVASDKSLQDGKIIFPADLKGDKITLTFSPKIKIWWKVPNASKWTEIPKEDSTEFKKFTNGEIPLKIEGISPGSGSIKFSFVIGKNTITDSLNFKVIKTCRLASIIGAAQHFDKDDVDTDLYNNKIAPSGRFHVVHKLIASVKEVNQYADNLLVDGEDEFPNYWNRVIFITDGSQPHYSKRQKDSDYLYFSYDRSEILGVSKKDLQRKRFFKASTLDQFGNRFDRKEIKYDNIEYGDYNKNIKWFDNHPLLDGVYSYLTCGAENAGWPDLHSPKVELYLYSCFNYWAWEKQGTSKLLKRVGLDTQVKWRNIFNKKNGELKPKIEYYNYGAVNKGAINVQHGGLTVDFIYPLLARKYLYNK